MGSFMQPEIYEGKAYLIQNDHAETTVLPYECIQTLPTERDEDATDEDDLDELSQWVEGGNATSYEVKTGWLARMQAPGYLDATEWDVCDTEAEAIRHLLEMYESGADEMEEWEVDCVKRLAELGEDISYWAESMPKPETEEMEETESA